MGIRNREGSLYMATGIDNSGLYEGKREAMGIIKTLASDITSFDIFGGIGISAATAFAPNAKTAPQTIDFNHASLDNLLRYSDNKFFTDIFYLLYFKSSRLSQAAARGGTGKQAVRPAFPL